MSISRISPELARTLFGHAHKFAEALGVPMCFTIVDEAGYVIDVSRAPGAGWTTIDLSGGKARLAAAFGRPTADLAAGWAEASLFATALIVQAQGTFVPAPGGAPIHRAGTLLGAIGASGGTGAQDQSVITGALEAIQTDLTAE